MQSPEALALLGELASALSAEPVEDGPCEATSVEPAEIDTAAGPPPEAMDAAPLTGEPDAPSEENLSNLQAPPSAVLNTSTATTARCGSS